MDRYTKSVLTMIAVGLWALVLVLALRPAQAVAGSEIIDVRIISYSSDLAVQGLPVNIVEVAGIATVKVNGDIRGVPVFIVE